jgi:hypothetical protein
MDLNLMVIDNFLDDPDKIREFALKQRFDIRGGFPGVRATWTNPAYDKELDEKLFELIGKNVEHLGSSKNFQICTEYEDDNWIHHDRKDIAGVLYLTPNAPVEYGTSIFRHKPTGTMYGYDGDRLGPNIVNYNKEEDWEEITNIGNVYNRLILYNGFHYHRSNNFGFGTTLEFSRLTQTFFMNFKDDK